MTLRYKHLKLEFTKEFIESLPKTANVATRCWLYSGYLLRGYGIVCIDYKDYLVHRLSVAVYHNKDYYDSSWEACHLLTCKNKNCFNPTHLYAGTHLDNMNDMAESGNHWNEKKLSCPKCGGPYTTYRMRTGTRAGKTQRRCNNCYRKSRRKRG